MKKKKKSEQMEPTRLASATFPISKLSSTHDSVTSVLPSCRAAMQTGSSCTNDKKKTHTHTHNNETIQEGFPITITVKFVVHTSTNREATAITIKGTIGCTQYHGWNEHFARQLLQRKMPQIASGTNMLAEERERWICPTLFCWGRMKNTQVNQ